MAKKDIAGFVCRPYCTFYREGVKEELICEGARLLEILNDNGELPETLPDKGAEAVLSPDSSALMEEIVCRRCPFFAEDCDFRAVPPLPDAEPCGGFILLTLLVAGGLISLERLKEIAHG